MIMKGHSEPQDFLRAVLNKEWGLRTGKILSHVAVFDSVKLDRLILMTDAAMVMYPTLEEKIAMINNTIPVCQALEIEDPKGSSCVCSRGIKSFHAAYTGCSFPGHHEPERPV